MRNLDQLDLDILAHLFRDAGMTNKDLAALVGVAPSTCLERVRKLQQDGVLKGAHCGWITRPWAVTSRPWSPYCNWPVTVARSSMRFATPSWPCPR